MKAIAVAILVWGLAGCVAQGLTTTPKELADAPYGTATFSPYADIDEIKQLKAVYDFYFPNPNSVPLVLSSYCCCRCSERLRQACCGGSFRCSSGCEACSQLFQHARTVNASFSH